MKKRISLMIAIAVCFSMLLSGCGKKLTTENAPDYVKSALDACYKADFDAYMEFTKSTQEEAEELYQTGLDTNMEASGIVASSVSSDLQDQYRQLFADLLSISKYEVGEAKEDGDGFTVEVTVEPFIMFNDLQQELGPMLESEEAQALADEEIEQYIYQKMYELMSSKLDAPEYGDPETVTIHIQPDGEGIQTINEDDLAALDAAMYSAVL